MNLEKMKRLEDLKARAQELGKKTRSQFLDRRRAAIDGAKQSFSQFFKAKGFTVQDSGANVSATYGGMTIRLDYPSPEQDYIGIVSRLDLNISGSKTGTYMIPINKQGQFPSISVRHMAPTKQANSEDEILDRQITEEEDKITRAEELLNSPQEPLVYGLKKEGTSPTDTYPQFESFNDLLSEIFK